MNNQPEPTLTPWRATWRVDTEEFFTTDSHTYMLPTQDLAEAAKLVQKEIAHDTLISLARDDF